MSCLPNTCGGRLFWGRCVQIEASFLMKRREWPKRARWVRRKLVLVKVDESEDESESEWEDDFIEVEEPEGYRSEEY